MLVKWATCLCVNNISAAVLVATNNKTRGMTTAQLINLPPGQNGRHCRRRHFQMHFHEYNRISMKIVHIDNGSASVQYWIWLLSQPPPSTQCNQMHNGLWFKANTYDTNEELPNIALLSYAPREYRNALTFSIVLLPSKNTIYRNRRTIYSKQPYNYDINLWTYISPLEKVAAISQTILLDTLSWMEISYFHKKFTEVCS